MIRFSIQSRLIFGALFMIVLLFGSQAYGIYALSQSNLISEEIYTDSLPSLNYINEERAHILRARVILDRVISHSELPSTQDSILRAEKYIAEASKAWASYISLKKDQSELVLANEISKKKDEFVTKGLTPILNAIKAGKLEEADNINTKEVPKLFAEYLEKLADLSKYQFQSTENNLKINSASFENTVATSTGVTLIAALVILFAIWSMLVAIRKPLDMIASAAQSIGQGDLTTVLRPQSQDELGQLVVVLDTMRSRLEALVGKVRISSESIAASSIEIASGNMDLSQRTESQAIDLERTVVSIEKLSKIIEKNTLNSKTASDLAVVASQVACEGGNAIRNVVHTMHEIQISSRHIGEIINVINGIAFQTNILALNAAVEAARAGPQGRGFAVVASEVRVLAQRSATAAKEIKELIDTSVNKIEIGASQVDKAGLTINKIVTSIQDVTNIMSDISLTVNEQSQGILSVNNAIASIDAITQQNAALVEEIASASSSLKEETKSLNLVMNQFKVTTFTTPAIASLVDTQSLLQVPRASIFSAVETNTTDINICEIDNPTTQEKTTISRRYK